MLSDPSVERLPTEAELVAAHGVSRSTVRRAYQELESEGLVERTRRRGTFAAPRSQYVSSSGSIDDLLAIADETEVELLEPLRRTQAAPTGIRATFGEGTDLMTLSFRRLYENQPFSLTQLWLPVTVGDLLSKRPNLTRVGARQKKFSIVAILDEVLPSPPATARQEVTVVSAPPEVAEVIGCTPMRGILQIDRVFLTASGETVEYSTNFFHPERYVYRMELRRSRR